MSDIHVPLPLSLILKYLTLQHKIINPTHYQLPKPDSLVAKHLRA